MNVFSKRRLIRLMVYGAVALWTVAYGFAAVGAPPVSHGPSFPPDPWCGKAAHSSRFPSSPWDGKVAHGPSFPPDPWCGRV
jgi:hypothetical protein